jgi:NitT/TauT family transport system ATP-binding protein
MARPVLVVESVQMTFDSPDAPLEALEEATLTVAENEFVSIIGPSGCGKSTLLRILAGLVRATRGTVWLNGREVSDPPPEIGIVFQHSNLMPWRTALDNVMLPLQVQRVPADQAHERALRMLDLVGLADFGAALPRELSGGMQQRVALARALVHEPDVLLLDEPFGALDALTRERMNWELLRIWQQRRTTVLMVTHSIQEAVALSDRVLVMTTRPGRIGRQVLIDLPRPRSQDVLDRPHFATLAHMLREALANAELCPTCGPGAGS